MGASVFNTVEKEAGEVNGSRLLGLLKTRKLIIGLDTKCSNTSSSVIGVSATYECTVTLMLPRNRFRYSHTKACGGVLHPDTRASIRLSERRYNLHTRSIVLRDKPRRISTAISRTMQSWTAHKVTSTSIFLCVRRTTLRPAGALVELKEKEVNQGTDCLPTNTDP